MKNSIICKEVNIKIPEAKIPIGNLNPLKSTIIDRAFINTKMAMVRNAVKIC